MYHCTGVRVCEFLDPEIKDLHHYKADIPLFVKMEEKRKELLAQEVDSLVKQVPHTQTEACLGMEQCVSRRQKCSKLV
jgi:ferredoxin